MRAALIVFVFALAIHFAYFEADRSWVAPDSHKYLVPAANLLAGEGFTRDGRPETTRTPGYPILLAALRATGLNPRQITLLQHVAAAVLAGALLALVRRMTGSNAVAWVSAIYVAIDLPTIHHANLVLTETFFTCFALLLFWWMWRLGEGTAGAGLALAAGLLTGWLTLIRPIAVLYFVPLALHLAWSRRASWRRVVPVFVAGAILLPGFWIARNARVAGIATISTNGVRLLTDYHAPAVLAMDDAGDFATNVERRTAEVRAAADARARRELGREDLRSVPDAERARSDARLGREIVLSHPVAFLRVLAYGVALNLLGGNAEALTRITGITRAQANAILLPYNALALVFATLGMFVLLKKQRPLGVLVLLTVAYFISTSAGVISYSRFRVPVVPMYSIAVATGICAVAMKLFPKREPAPNVSD